LNCEELSKLLSYIDRISGRDLVELSMIPVGEIIRDAHEIFDLIKWFERECHDRLPQSIYNHVLGELKFALLKLSTSLQDKIGEKKSENEFANLIIDYFTSDEKNALREFERFSKLDPNVTPPQVLADIITAEKGEIYALIKEAVGKEYIDLGRVLKTWESKLNIRNDLARVFMNRYMSRFRNIIESIKLLLDQQPAWLKRFFKEYEDELLDSMKVRVRFEREYNRIFSLELGRLEEKLKNLDEERRSLQSEISKLLKVPVIGIEEKRTQSDILFKIQDLWRRYDDAVNNFEAKIKRLEVLRRSLEEKRKGLENLMREISHDSTLNDLIKLEIDSLVKTLDEYESKIRDYESEKERLRELESIIKGEVKGYLISREIGDLYSEMLISRAHHMLSEEAISLYNPIKNKNIKVNRWNTIERYESILQTPSGPLKVYGITFSKMRGMILKTPDIIVEYATLLHKEPLESIGYDAKPVDISEFLSILKARIKEAEKGQYYHIILLSSPTGFTSTLINHIGGENFWKNFTSRYVTVYLLNIVDGKIYFNVGDKGANLNQTIANIELPEEKIEKVKKYLLSDEARVDAVTRGPSPAVKSLSIGQIAEATGVKDKTVLRRALGILESEEVGRVKEIKGEIVFIYS